MDSLDTMRKLGVEVAKRLGIESCLVHVDEVPRDSVHSKHLGEGPWYRATIPFVPVNATACLGHKLTMHCSGHETSEPLAADDAMINHIVARYKSLWGRY
jgi:hypothetical protein